MVISNKLPVESLMDIWVNRKTYILEGACLAVLALSQGQLTRLAQASAVLHICTGLNNKETILGTNFLIR